MNNEVKELLSRLKRCNEEQYLVEIDCRCSKLLLDCITDLKEENENYKSRCEKAIEFIKKNTHEYKMFNKELGYFSNLTNISIDKNNKVFINDLLKILGGDE